MAEPADFRDFYQANYRRMVAIVSAVMGDRAEAEDVVQEAFARALARWGRLGGYDLPEAWVRRVALRIATDSGRRLARAIRVRARLSAQRPGQPAAPDESLSFTGLAHALRQLPLAQREVLVLHYLADLSVEQIAAAHWLTSGAGRSQASG